jgi:dihydroorotase-like cyclic amidohydrolase
MLEGLADGSVDAIATDHAPHHHDEKHVEFDRAPFGIVGLETAVSLRSTGSCTRASSRSRGWSSCCR